MKTFLVIAVAILLVGCARHYKVTLSNGNSFTTNSKPKLNKDGSAYLYKDLNGKESWIPAGKVTEISRQ
jgi:hypothetical protein